MLQGVPPKGEGSMDPPHCQAKAHTICLNPSLVHNLRKPSSNNNNRFRTLYPRVDKLSRLNKDHLTVGNKFNMLNSTNILLNSINNLLKCNITCNNKCQGFMDNTQIMLQQQL